MKKLITLLSLLVTISFYAQNAEVKGQIKDDQGNEIAFANIVFKNKKDSLKVFGTIGGEDGKFKLKIPRAIYTVEVSIVGVKPKLITLDASQKRKIDMGIIEISSSVALDAVVVKSNPSSYKIDLEKKVYDVSKDITARGGTLAEVMQNLPSVQVEPDLSISIRGDSNVRILVDGRPNGLASTANLFSTIPASSIERVEVITNPSSRYAAQGSAGIINIVLKKGKKKQLSTSLEVFTGYRLNVGTNVNVSQTGETGSWYLNGGVGYSEPKAINNISLIDLVNTSETSDQESDRIRNQSYYLFNVGGRKNFNEKTSLVASATFRQAGSDNFNETTYRDFTNNNLSNSSLRDEDEEEDNTFVQGSVTFDQKFAKEGHKLSINTSAEYTKLKEDAAISSSDIFPVQQNLDTDITGNDEEMSRYVISMDYILPLEKNVTFELGYRSDLTRIENDFSVERSTSQGDAFIIPEFTDQTKYTENVHAFYSQISKKYKKLAFKLGLRAEISDIDITSARNNFKDAKNYTNLFPSAFISYNVNEKNELQVSASRRVNRPRSWMIIPFSTFTDERNIFVGNPDINPSFIVATELNYIYKASNNLGFYPTVFYRKTNDEVEFFVERQQLTIGNQTQDFFASTIANIGDYTAYGGEIGMWLKATEWWNMWTEVIFNGFRQRGSFRGASFDGDGLLFTARYNANFTLFKSTKFQIQSYYRGPIETGQYRRRGFYAVNLGLSRSLFDGKGSIAVNVRDLFNSNKRLVITFGTDFERDLELQYRVRQINVSFTYRFTKQKGKGKKGNQYDSYEIIN
ncbi:TonB-dependent receptor SusC [Kordia sp. SMS9]|uniref:outer membrane beta-barrel protein n=1 Tax=Kordia sp. SMS9 TaxID=2282170 RepID=UPI000E0CEEC6|nr:outer membrane beta-barrel protein [Kordia sp. SMS9]AXG70234.1 TonB-dependent receptor SusC [Kordia sp. SMS9]